MSICLNFLCICPQAANVFWKHETILFSRVFPLWPHLQFHLPETWRTWGNFCPLSHHVCNITPQQCWCLSRVWSMSENTLEERVNSEASAKLLLPLRLQSLFLEYMVPSRARIPQRRLSNRIAILPSNSRLVFPILWFRPCFFMDWFASHACHTSIVPLHSTTIPYFEKDDEKILCSGLELVLQSKQDVNLGSCCLFPWETGTEALHHQAGLWLFFN